MTPIESRVDPNEKTFKYCSVQLSLFSLILVTSLSGLCVGLAWALIIAVLDIAGIIELAKFKNYLINFMAFPFLGLFFGALFSIVGYPLYSWACKNLRGQKLSGIFHDPHD
nr:hypothetical protein [Pseudomonas benzenivorans]